MSRIGRIPVQVPKDVKIVINPVNIHVEGPKGKLDLALARGIQVELKDGFLLVKRDIESKQASSNHGTIRACLANMVEGVTKGHKKSLEIQGIGFRASLQGKKILFNLGLSHPVEFPFPDSVKVAVTDQTAISIEGADLIEVGQIAAKIREIKPVEPYKGKGIRYLGENVRRKQGKSVTK